MRAKRRAGHRRSKTYAILCSGSAGARGKRAGFAGTGLSRRRLSHNERSKGFRSLMLNLWRGGLSEITVKGRKRKLLKAHCLKAFRETRIYPLYPILGKARYVSPLATRLRFRFVAA